MDQTSCTTPGQNSMHYTWATLPALCMDQTSCTTPGQNSMHYTWATLPALDISQTSCTTSGPNLFQYKWPDSLHHTWAIQLGYTPCTKPGTLSSCTLSSPHFLEYTWARLHCQKLSPAPWQGRSAVKQETTMAASNSARQRTLQCKG